MFIFLVDGSTSGRYSTDCGVVPIFWLVETILGGLIDGRDEEQRHFRDVAWKRLAKLAEKRREVLKVEEERRESIRQSGFAYYLAQHYKSWLGYTDTTRADLKPLSAFAHYLLQLSTGQIQYLTLIIDREKHDEVKSSATAEALLPILNAASDSIRKEFRNGRLFVEIIEVDHRALTPAIRQRLAAIKTHQFSLTKPYVLTAYVDTASDIVWSKAPLPFHRWGLERLLRGANSGIPQLLRCEREFGVHPKAIPWLTYLSMLLLVVVFLFEVIRTERLQTILQIPPSEYHEQLGLLSSAWRLEELTVQLGTYSLLHGGLVHLITNLFVMLLAGSLVERLLGRSWCLIGYAAGAIGGGLLFLALALPNTLLRGASAGIMGLATIGMVALIRVPQGPTNRFYGAYLVSVLVASLLPLYDGVSYAAHLGGVCGAAIFAPLLLWQWRPQTLKPEHRWLVIVCATFAGLWLLYVAYVVLAIVVA